MAKFPSVVSLALLLASVSAQVQEHVWSSVAYLLYGDRTPLLDSVPASLTPLGAHQLFSQGSMFRARYLDASAFTGGENAVTTHAPIYAIETHAIDNAQVSIFSTTDEYVSASAMAFMQGLYPPSNQTASEGSSGIGAAVLANGSMIDFPLNGYQYPNIQTLSVLDPNAIWWVRLTDALC
jgi:hypothetical protein